LSRWVAGAAPLLAIVAAAGAVASAVRSAGRVGRAVPAQQEASAGQRVIRGPVRPQVAEGVRAGHSGRGGAPLLMAPAAGATAVLFAAVVFGSSLTAVVSRPASYGWPWDIAMLGGAGHGGIDVDTVRSSLAARSDVAGWTALGLADVTVDGRPELSVIDYGTGTSNTG